VRGIGAHELHNKGTDGMASSGKKKTTMAKLMRESRLRERRLDKQARKDARKLAPADDQQEFGETFDGDDGDDGEAAAPGGREPALATVVEAPGDA
jgi:hypothetical protein